jgi:hypothetical protein
MNNSLIERYNTLNNSFKRTLVFHAGASAGFFSEYNCMILAILYCLKNKIRFVLYSKDANFGYKDGWTDFFEPFCEQTTCIIHKHLNVRMFKIRYKHGLVKWRLKGIFLQNVARMIKIFTSFSYFTQDLWDNFFSVEMLEQEYDIPELDIKGDFVHACNRLVELTWNYNTSTKTEIERIMERCSLPDRYISCHIRRGDKNTEFNHISLEEYIDNIDKYDISDVYILTDDYTVYETLQKERPEWKCHTLCHKYDTGYNHSVFSKIDDKQKRNRILELFASIEIMNKSTVFIGTKTSNPGIFMSIYNPCITKGIDCENNLFVELMRITG